MKLAYLALMASLFIASCKKKEDDGCHLFIPPAVNDLYFRLVDNATGNDLLATSAAGYSRDSISASQPCYAMTPTVQSQLYTVPGSSNQACVFNFPNLRNAALDESTDCFLIYMRWNSTDVDTLQWHYHNLPDGNCNYQVLDFVNFNGTGVAKINAGGYNYWELRK